MMTVISILIAIIAFAVLSFFKIYRDVQKELQRDIEFDDDDIWDPLNDTLKQ